MQKKCMVHISPVQYVLNLPELVFGSIEDCLSHTKGSHCDLYFDLAYFIHKTCTLYVSVMYGLQHPQ